jgi:hypothetical protein
VGRLRLSASARPHGGQPKTNAVAEAHRNRRTPERPAQVSRIVDSISTDSTRPLASSFTAIRSPSHHREARNPATRRA